jgi:hypothetical protein
MLSALLGLEDKSRKSETKGGREEFLRYLVGGSECWMKKSK